MAATQTICDIQDETAVSIAFAVAVANSRAAELGYKLERMKLCVTQEVLEGISVWLVYYGPDGTVCQRGGDVKVWVSADDNSIVRVLRGQ